MTKTYTIEVELTTDNESVYSQFTEHLMELAHGSYPIMFQTVGVESLSDQDED